MKEISTFEKISNATDEIANKNFEKKDNKIRVAYERMFQEEIKKQPHPRLNRVATT